MKQHTLRIVILILALQFSTMMGKAYKAVIIGGSGEVGGHVLKTLLSSPNCTHITSLGRRKIDFPENQPGLEKLTQHVVDLDNLEQDVSKMVIKYF